MENALNMIVEADRAARERVEQARERREALTKALAEQKKEIDEAHTAEAKAEIERARQAKQQKLEAQSHAISQREEKLAARLEERYNAGHAAWEDTLFSAVTKGE